MSKSALIQRLFHRPRTVLLPLALFAVLYTSTPATAQQSASPPLAARTPAFMIYARSEAPAAKEDPGKLAIPVTVTPNPSMGSFRARLGGSRDEQVRVEILDRNGRLIDARQVTAQSELRFGYWYAPGVYFLQVVQGDSRQKIRLVKRAE